MKTGIENAMFRSMTKYIILSLFLSLTARASDHSEVRALAEKNGLKPDKAVIQAIVKASRWYNVNPLELTAIGILETGLGKYNQTVYNKNGTQDVGIFQINTVNRLKCNMFDLNTAEGSAMCAAKLLQQIRRKYSTFDPQWPAIYHSKTKKHKQKYFEKITKVLAVNAE